MEGSGGGVSIRRGGGMSIRRGGWGSVGAWTSLWYTKRCSAVSVDWIRVVENGLLDEQSGS